MIFGCVALLRVSPPPIVYGGPPSERERLKFIRARARSIKATPEQLGAAFGALVRDLRGAKGCAQTEMASKAGVTKAHLSFIERGRRLPDLQNIFGLARALGAAPSEILEVLEEILAARVASDSAPSAKRAE